MEDSRIVELYWERSESAISETQKKYNNYCHKIAYNILTNHEDAGECVNDTYLRAWNSMPPHRPSRISTYLGKITRNLSLTCLEKRNRQKRGMGKIEIALSELEECICKESFVNQDMEEELIANSISDYLQTLSKESRMAFIGRYYHFNSIQNISQHLGISKSKTKSMLYRIRIGLKEHLKKVGIEV